MRNPGVCTLTLIATLGMPRLDSSLKNMCNSKSEIELGNKERRHLSPRTSVMWFSRCAASIGVGLSFMSSGTFRIYALI